MQDQQMKDWTWQIAVENAHARLKNKGLTRLSKPAHELRIWAR